MVRKRKSITTGNEAKPQHVAKGRRATKRVAKAQVKAKVSDSESGNEQSSPSDYDDYTSGTSDSEAPKSSAKIATELAPDDDLPIGAALLGFFLCLLGAALLPAMGVDQNYIMASGMTSLCAIIIFMNFWPRKRTTSDWDEEEISATLVFVCSGCVGVMLGGMFGGMFKYYI